MTALSDFRRTKETSARPDIPSSERLHYLDSLRSFCMLFGLLVHATTLGTYEWLSVIPFISDQFRMATFFAASAVLSTLVLRKRPTTLFVRKRLVMLLLPLVAGVLLLNPLTLWLIWQVHGPEPETLVRILSLSISPADTTKPRNLVWHLHLWFLFSLAIYALLTPGLNRIMESERVRHALDTALSRIPSALRVLFVALTATVIGVLLRVTGEVVFPQLYDWWLSRATLLNLTFFIVGILIANSKELREIGFDPVSVSISVVLILLLRTGMVVNESTMEKILSLCISQIVNISAIFFLMWVFRRFANRPSKIGTLIIQAIYTIYLFHYLFIYVIGALFLESGVSKYTIYSIAVLVSFFGGVMVHWIVAHTAYLSWLFNGKALSRPAAR